MGMNTVKLNAYAKLNLTLDIVGAEGGYHMLDSLVTTVNLADRITLRRRKDGLVRIRMHGLGKNIPPEENNAQRAGDAFVEKFGTCGADVTIHKNIPIGAGMGGSSADIAGVIAGMGMLYSVSDMDALKALADRLGSDSGYLLSGGLARIRGKGEKVEPLPFVPLHFLVLFPKEGVLAGEAYAAFDASRAKGSRRTEEAASLLRSGNADWAAKSFGNDLFAAACGILPAVGEAFLDLKAFSPLGVSMTGSGSAVFAAFESEELCLWAKSRYRGKCRAVALKSVDPKARIKRRSPFVLGGEEIEEP